MRAEVAALEARVAEAEADAEASGQLPASNDAVIPTEIHVPNAISTEHGLSEEPQTWPLHAEEYTRYGRQMIMPEIGLEGRLRLRPMP